MCFSRASRGLQFRLGFLSRSKVLWQHLGNDSFSPATAERCQRRSRAGTVCERARERRERGERWNVHARKSSRDVRLKIRCDCERLIARAIIIIVTFVRHFDERNGNGKRKENHDDCRSAPRKSGVGHAACESRDADSHGICSVRHVSFGYPVYAVEGTIGRRT